MTGRLPRAAAVLLPLLGACATATYGRIAIDQPLAAWTPAELRPGVDDLGSCLRALGAPNLVRECDRSGDGDAGILLVWTWQETADFGVEVSADYQHVSLSGSFAQSDARTQRCVLWLDSQWRLRAVLAGAKPPGFVPDAAPEARR